MDRSRCFQQAHDMPCPCIVLYCVLLCSMFFWAEGEPISVLQLEDGSRVEATLVTAGLFWGDVCLHIQHTLDTLAYPGISWHILAYPGMLRATCYAELCGRQSNDLCSGQCCWPSWQCCQAEVGFNGFNLFNLLHVLCPIHGIQLRCS